MNKKWLTLLLVLILILSISACNKKEEASSDVEAPAPQTEQDEDLAEHADADTDGEDHSDEADTDDAQTDGGDADTEEESSPVPPTIDAAQVFAANCAGCHGNKRQGGGGPSLLPERLTKAASDYAKTISEGVSGTRMPSWKDKLTAEEITALSEWILTPVE